MKEEPAMMRSPTFLLLLHSGDYRNC